MSEFTDFLVEIFEPFGAVRVRAMFGGHGLYHREIMFGLIANDALYLKADAQSLARFEARGLKPFDFETKSGKVIKMSYHQAPEEIYDDAQAALEWARLAYDAALRSQKSAKKNPVKKSTRTSGIGKRKSQS